MIVEEPYRLRRDCANCPESAGGRGVLRHDGSGAGVVTCAACNTPNFVVQAAAPGADRSVPCPDCGRALRETGPCPHCGLPRRGIDAVWALREYYLATLADLATTHRQAVEAFTTRHEETVKLVVSAFPRTR